MPLWNERKSFVQIIFHVSRQLSNMIIKLALIDCQFITNYYILTWKVKVSAVAKFITVKLNFELSPVSKDKS